MSLNQQLSKDRNDQADQIKLAVKEDNQHSNAFNFNRMSQYTHRTFLNTFEKVAPAVYNAIHQLLLASPFADHPQCKVELALANIFAWIAQIYDIHNFLWEYSVIQASVLRSVTKSTFVTNVLSGTFPGSPTAQTLTRRMGEWTKVVLGNNLEIDSSSSVATIVFDNCPGGAQGT